MSNPKGFIFTVAIIAFPIIYLAISLNSIKATYETSSGDEYSKTEMEINSIIEEQVNSASHETSSGSTYAELVSGEITHSSIYGNPISKLIEGAKVNVASANIYQEPDELSSVVGSVFKDTVVTIQDYENGWSNVKTGDLAGWIRTEFVTKPGEGNTSLTSAVGHKAKIIVSSTLNVRDSASTNAAAIDAIAGGQEVNIIGANADESWYQIQYGTKSGWISANKEYVQVIY